jgi:hypothetical protein
MPNTKRSARRARAASLSSLPARAHVVTESRVVVGASAQVVRNVLVTDRRVGLPAMGRLDQTLARFIVEASPCACAGVSVCSHRAPRR